MMCGSHSRERYAAPRRENSPTKLEANKPFDGASGRSSTKRCRLPLCRPPLDLDEHGICRRRSGRNDNAGGVALQDDQVVKSWRKNPRPPKRRLTARRGSGDGHGRQGVGQRVSAFPEPHLALGDAPWSSDRARRWALCMANSQLTASSESCNGPVWRLHTLIGRINARCTGRRRSWGRIDHDRSDVDDDGGHEVREGARGRDRDRRRGPP
jgi:hypothetical protein